MKRSRNYDKEFSREDRLKKENAQLKRDNSKLRRALDRANVNLDQFENLKGLIDKQNKEAESPKKAKRDWTCFQCGRGTMNIHIITRRDGTFYFRRCSLTECGHRTNLQKYSEDVENS